MVPAELELLLDTAQASREGSDDNNRADANIRRLIRSVDSKRISKHLFYIAWLLIARDECLFIVVVLHVR